MRRDLVLSDGLQVVFLGGWPPVSLLFSHNFFYTPPMLILISYSGSYRHSTSGYTVYEATELMHGAGDQISVTKICSRLWGLGTGEFALST